MTDKDYYKYMWYQSMRNGCTYPVITFAFLFVLFMLCSCAAKTKIEYVDREVVKYETKIQHDTLISNVHDSVYHTVFQRGDTIYNTKYVEKTKYRDRIVEKIDTCYLDKVQTKIAIEVQEKKVIPNWCYISLFCWLIIIIFAFVKVYKWRR